MNQRNLYLRFWPFFKNAFVHLKTGSTASRGSWSSERILRVGEHVVLLQHLDLESCAEENATEGLALEGDVVVRVVLLMCNLRLLGPHEV